MLKEISIRLYVKKCHLSNQNTILSRTLKKVFYWDFVRLPIGFYSVSNSFLLTEILMKPNQIEFIVKQNSKFVKHQVFASQEKFLKEHNITQGSI